MYIKYKIYISRKIGGNALQSFPDWEAAIDWINERLSTKLVSSINRFQTISHASHKTRQTAAVELTSHAQEKVQAEFGRFTSNARHEGRYDLLLEWSQSYLSSIAQAGSNSSLHDQLKILLATSFNDYGAEKHADQDNEFQLLLGDVSGIQSYLLSIAHIGAGSVAKQLRARSFYLSQMPKLAAQYIVDELGLTTRHILMVTGGVFLVCIRKQDDISVIRQRMNEMLYEQHHGMLQLHLATQSISNTQCDSIAATLSELHASIRESKMTPLFNVLQRDGAWRNEQESTWLHTRAAGAYCVSCKKHPVLHNLEELCLHCARDVEIGRKLPTSIGMQIIAHSSNAGARNKQGILLWERYEIKLIQKLDEIAIESVLLEAWNNKEQLESFSSASNGWVSTVYVSNYVPRTNGATIATFEEIAAQSKGDKLLGVYKADLDHLGSLLSFGLRNDQQTYQLAEYINASRTLEKFIGEQLTSIIVRNYPHLYTVFSGGDDLFLIGPWSDMLQFSIDMKRSFDAFTDHNPEVTISAAVVIASCKTPLSVLAEQAEDMLAKAKDTPSPIRSSEHGRNQLCLNGTLVEWNDAPIIHEQMQRWTSWEQSGQASHQFFRKLVEFSLMKQSYHQHNKIEGLRYQALFNYMINRLERNKYNELMAWAEQLQRSRLETDSEIYRLWCLIPIIYEMFTYLRGGR